MDEGEDEGAYAGIVGKVCGEILTNQQFQLPLKMFHCNAAKLLQTGSELEKFSRSLELYLSKSLKTGLNLSTIWSAFHTITIGEELNKM